GSELPDDEEIIRRPRAADGVFADRVGTSRARALSRSHGSADQSDKGGLGNSPPPFPSVLRWNADWRLRGHVDDRAIRADLSRSIDDAQADARVVDVGQSEALDDRDLNEAVRRQRDLGARRDLRVGEKQRDLDG